MQGCTVTVHIQKLAVSSADILQLALAYTHSVAANRSQQPNGHEAVGPPAGLPGSEPPHAHHHPSLPLHELKLQCIRKHTQNHDGEKPQQGLQSLTLPVCSFRLCMCFLRLHVYLPDTPVVSPCNQLLGLRRCL